MDAEKGFQLLNKFLGLDAKVAGLIDDAVKSKAISEEELKWLGGVVNDIRDEQVARHERVLSFLADLYGAAVDLGQENARHAQGMLTVSNLELRRWALIGNLNDDYQEIFTATPGRDYALFADAAAVRPWNNRFQSNANVNPDLRLHPVVAGPTARNPDNILVSVRKLAQTAKAWQRDPQVNDPDGFNLKTAHDRLFKAVRTVDGYLLLISVNRHMSEENLVRLHAELATHDIRLDTLKTRVEEAGYRLALGDLKAFHASGITDADLQNLSNAFANGLLAWIGSGTNNP